MSGIGDLGLATQILATNWWVVAGAAAVVIVIFVFALVTAARGAHLHDDIGPDVREPPSR
jgi:uncharacterized membrane protein